jgi:hypothetical protein
MIKLELTHTAFAEKPRYEALSYTWGGTQDQEYVHVNGKRFSIRQNLYRALQHFRHGTETRILWIDAICINQEDNGEKSWQVKLMADIYRRARRVLVWLGVMSEPVSLSIPTTSPARQIAVEQEQKELCQQPYWSRVWIVQEVGAAVDIDIHWDAMSSIGFGNTLRAISMSWDDFFKSLLDRSQTNQAIQLAQQREDRYGDAYLLPNLIESCSRCLCELPHDKIYGFVGIAHDCDDGSFPVDYAKSLWELYEDTIRFCYKSVDFKGPRSIVRFSHIVLGVLGDVGDPPAFKPVRSKGCAPCYGHIEDVSCLFKVEAVNGGEVSILGPTYDEFTGNPSAARAWNSEISRCTTTDVVARLRAENDTFMTSLLALEDSQMPGIVASIIDSFGWIANGRYEGVRRYCIKPNVFLNDRQHWRSSDYRLFSTKNGSIGLVHVSVDIGDEIFHFWDSDVVAVVREEERGILRVIGKAFMAKQQHTAQNPASGLGGLNMNETTDLYLDIVALRNLTSSPLSKEGVESASTA